jgi:hypothetical protein
MADAAGIVARQGWPCRTCASLATAAAQADDILLHAVDATLSPAQLPAVAPTIALAPSAWIAAIDWAERGYVAAVDRSRLAADLPAAVADWCHDARLATLDRLADTFGAAPIAQLLNGFRHTLEEALATRDTATLAAQAHRIAGLAGTLGFAALGRHWQRVAEHAPPPSAATLLATAHALATLDRARNRGAFTIS